MGRGPDVSLFETNAGNRSEKRVTELRFDKTVAFMMYNKDT